MKDYYIKKGFIHLKQKPRKKIKDGIKIYFGSSFNRDKNYWPMLTTDIEKGQTDYELPHFIKRFHIIKIKKIEICRKK